VNLVPTFADREVLRSQRDDQTLKEGTHILPASRNNAHIII
jgi:hypothetical protein